MVKNKSQPISSNEKCLVCGDAASRLSRGLCIKHYEQYRRKKDSLNDELAVQFEADSIAAGLLLPSRQGKKAGSVNPYEAVVANLQKKPSTDDEDEVLLRQTLAQIQKKLAEIESKKATETTGRKKTSKG
jgi:hypothetical protein